MHRFFYPLMLSLLCLSICATPQLSKEECGVIVEDLQRLSNIKPQEVEEKASNVLRQLQNGETLTAYFIAYNIYVENLFNKGKTQKARCQIEVMLEQAAKQDNLESKVIALRTQGTFYYKLGLYDRAADCFREAMTICPPYNSKLLEHCFTWSSTLFWLVHADLHLDRLEEAEHFLTQMDSMMQWLDNTGNIDNIGYKPVMIRALRAKIHLQRGNTNNAIQLLQQCQQYILPNVPPRAYVDYYEVKMLLALQEDKRQEALQLLDKLIDMHSEDYKPIAAEYIYQKGITLAEMGKFEESSHAFTQYIELKQQVDKLALACMLDELTTQYEVKKLQHERDNMHEQLMVVLTFCIAMVIIIGLIITMQRKMHKKNKALARNISELNRLIRETPPAPLRGELEGSAANSPLRLDREGDINIGNQIVEYINQTRCYLNADCSRETIKEGMGVSEHTLAKAIMAATGRSFVNYINQLRLNVSIEMLEEKPEMTINDIATACGFGTVRQFQRIFKQHYDLSPSAYRAANAS